MQELLKVSRCLISVSDKSGIVDLARFLQEKGVEIISTGGTKKLLLENKIKAKDISEFTGFPEIMDGRVKTLHPNVHGGLLGVLSDEKHMKQASDNNIESIDLLVVNLYPFVETLAKTDDAAEIIENIDIGGPAMVRSAAKNFAFKAVVTDASQYDELKAQMAENDGKTSAEFRKKLAIQAFTNIAHYDVAIANYFNQDAGDYFLSGTLKQSLRYGENAHQKAAVYSDLSGDGIVGAKQIQGKELSYNNFNDADAALALASEFDQPACAIIKHANPCGVALGGDLLQAYQKAFAVDSKSAFGGIVALNGEIDEALAAELSKIFFEVIIAKSITDSAREILSAKKNLRVLIADFKKTKKRQVKTVSGGFLVQDQDDRNIKKADLKQAGKRAASDAEIDELVFAMNTCKHVKSNAIVVVSAFQTIGIGAGQTSRVDACEIACKKAQAFGENNSAKGAVLASDAFFPFADNIEIAAKFGITAVVAPKGSIRDEEVVAMADEKGIAIYFIDSRHFRH